jgi:hypothetical protein
VIATSSYGVGMHLIADAVIYCCCEVINFVAEIDKNNYV